MIYFFPKVWLIRFIHFILKSLSVIIVNPTVQRTYVIYSYKESFQDRQKIIESDDKMGHLVQNV